LFARLVVLGVVASEYEAPEDVAPIISFDGSEKAAGNIRNFLQSLRFFQHRTRRRDILVLKQLSNKFHPLFIWDFGFLLDRAINEKDVSTDVESCGWCARRFMHYILHYTHDDFAVALHRLGAGRGVELVAKTYQSDVSASRELLNQLFELFEQLNFEIHYFINLARYVEHILPYDPEFVSMVYKEIFAHSETTN
jgi:hypothetical protein